MVDVSGGGLAQAAFQGAGVARCCIDARVAHLAGNDRLDRQTKHTLCRKLRPGPKSYQLELCRDGCGLRQRHRFKGFARVVQMEHDG